MTRFVLSLDLGNAAMEGPADIAEALRGVAAKLDDVLALSPPAFGRVFDANGNRVGTWRVLDGEGSES